MSSFQRLTVARLPRAALTLVLATAWSIVSKAQPTDERRRRRRLFGYGAAAYFVLFITAAMVSGSATTLWLAAGLLVGATAVCYLISAALLARAIWRPGNRAWTDDSGTLVVTARVVGPRTLDVGNLAGWPMGRGRSTPFLRELCTMADREGLTLTGHAGHAYLFHRLYAPLGFTTDNPEAKRPTIRRSPHSPEGSRGHEGGM